MQTGYRISSSLNALHVLNINNNKKIKLKIIYIFSSISFSPLYVIQRRDNLKYSICCIMILFIINFTSYRSLSRSHCFYFPIETVIIYLHTSLFNLQCICTMYNVSAVVTHGTVQQHLSNRPVMFASKSANNLENSLVRGS